MVNYLKRKTVIFEDERVEYASGRKAILDKIQEMKEKPKNMPEEMAHFREMYAIVDSWKKDVIRLRLSKS